MAEERSLFLQRPATELGMGMYTSRGQK